MAVKITVPIEDVRDDLIVFRKEHCSTGQLLAKERARGYTCNKVAESGGELHMTKSIVILQPRTPVVLVGQFERKQKCSHR